MLDYYGPPTGGGIPPWLVPSAERIEPEWERHGPPQEWQEFRLRPSVANPTASAQTGVTGLTWTHLSAAGKTIYLIVFCQGNLFNELATKETATFNGVAMKKHFRFAGTGMGFCGCIGFSLVDPPVGSFSIVFNGVDNDNYSAIAFNVANGPLDGCFLLTGGYAVGGALTKKGYAWDSDGLVIAAAYAGPGVTPAITGGTTFKSVDGMSAAYVSANDGEREFSATGGGSRLLITFMIPPSSQRVTGGDFYPWFGSRTTIDAIAAGASDIVGLPYAGSMGEGRLGAIIPSAGTARSLGIRTSIAPGAGNSVTAELMIGGQADTTATIGTVQMIPTGITVTISGTATEASIDGLEFYVYRYQRVGLRYTNSGAGALPAGITITPSILFESGTAREQVYGGGSMAFAGSSVDVAVRRGPLHPMHVEVWSTNDNSEKSLIGIECECTQLVVNYQREVAVTPDHDFYLEVNGVRQDGTGGTVDTKCTLVANTVGQALARWRGSVDLDPGDFLSVVAIGRTGSDLLRASATIVIRPTTRGEMMISGHSDTNGPETVFPNASRTEFTTYANESLFALMIPPMTAAGDDWHAGGLIGRLETSGPGTNKSLTFELRQELAATAMPGLTFTGSETFRTINGDVSYASGTLLTTRWIQVNSPTALRQWWSIPGFVQPQTGVIGPLAWVHWPRRIPSSPATTVTDSYTDHPGGMQCPADWENGWKDGLVTNFGDVERPASHLFTGDWQGSTFTFQIADKEAQFRAQAASFVDRYWNDALTVRMTTRANRADRGPAFTVFTGPIVEAQPTPSLLWDVTLGDVVKQGLLSDKAQIPFRIIRDSFLSQLDAISETLDRDRPEPIYYGAHTEAPDVATSPQTVAGFRVKPIYLGIQNIGGHDRHVWMVCGHAVKAISIYVDGVETPEDPFPGFGETWWIPGHGEWMDVFGVPFADLISDTYGTFRRYTLIYGRVGRDGPDDCAIGDRELTASVLGVEDIGDGTGELITDRFQQYKHFLINYVANQGPQSYQFGEWLQNPTWNIFDGDVTKVDEASFDDATDIGEERLFGGYVGAAAIGSGAGDRATAKTWIAAWNRSCACRFGINHQGQMHIFLLRPTAEIKAAAPLYTDAYEILDGSFATELKYDEHATAIAYKADYDESSGEWKTSGIERDEDVGELYGGEIVSEPREYPFAPGEEQARHLAILELRIRKHRPRYIRLDATIGHDPVTGDSLGYRDQGQYIRYVSFDAVQETREERLAQIINPIVRVGSRHVGCVAMDCEDLIDYDVASSPSP